MFKNFWYAVEFSTDLEVGKPKKVKILGQQLVLYRKNSDNSVVAMSDLCVHRGAALSGGTIKDDCIVCPYHGWEYSPDGAVQKVPAQPDKAIPRKARIDSYPTQEKYMFIWVYMGDLPEDERPPIPDWSEIDDTETYRAVTGSFLWNSNYERILENGVDVAHTPFVHGGVFGNPEKPEVPEFVMEESDWHCKISIVLNPPRSKGIWGMINPNRQALADRPPVPVSTTWYLPNMILLDVGTPMGAMKIFDVNIPIDDEWTLVKFVALRSFFKGKWADRDARRRVFKVLYEDQAIVDNVRPELLPFDLSAELHIKSDQNAVKYRRRRQGSSRRAGASKATRSSAKAAPGSRPGSSRPRRASPCPSWPMPGTSRRSAAARSSRAAARRHRPAWSTAWCCTTTIPLRSRPPRPMNPPPA
ncbi:Rieske 2Fe-2S domain-containing protein [Aeromicrobium sp. UC242_57]|uniref:aromatic ring-hydroxylating dioxygenase subunit alpha n=1 Tax=Aeromicrobium sp. UC242_57 TaxID=3374624 RepID=UPI00378B3B0F